MSSLPREPEAFAEHVATLLGRLHPEFAVELVGPRELLVDGRRLDLDNLYRMVSHDVPRGQEIVEHYLEQLFMGESLGRGELSLDFVRPRIMPRIQPDAIFQHLSRELVAHVSFVNDTSVVFVTDLPNMTVSITTEQVFQWGLKTEDLEEIARENLSAYSPSPDMQFVESREGAIAVIIAEQDGYDAARLLLDGLYESLAPRLGADFLVATPARDMFVAMSNGPTAFVERIRRRVLADFKRLPYPITPELFVVTRDGVAGTMPEDFAAGNEAA
ncbi:MAG: DUF1444 family protein [Planctomycetota bacterium]